MVNTDVSGIAVAQLPRRIQMPPNRQFMIPLTEEVIRHKPELRTVPQHRASVHVGRISIVIRLHEVEP